MVRLIINMPHRGTPAVFTRDKDWKEDDHKRDANGKFSKMAEKVVSPPVAAKPAAGHPTPGQPDYMAVAEKLKYDPMSYSSPNVQKYTGNLLKKMEAAKSAPDPIAALEAIHVSKSYAKPYAYKAALIKALQQSKAAPAPVAAPAPPPQPKPAPPPQPAQPVQPASPPVQMAPPKPGQPDLHAVAAKLKYDPMSYSSPNVQKYTGNLLKKMEAAKASPDPVAALEAIHVSKSYAKPYAYKQALLNAYQQGGAAQSGMPPNVVAQMLKPTAHAGPLTKPPPPPPGGASAMTYNGVDTKGQSFKSFLYTDYANIIGPPPSITGQYDNGAWDSYAHAVRKRMNGLEQQTAKSYQGNGYREMNKACAGVIPMTDAMKKKIAHMDSAVAKGRVPMDINVSRGINSPLAAVVGSTEHPDNLAGKQFCHEGFVSTSRASGFGGNVVLKFTVPKGSVGLPMPMLNNENEVVLPRRAMFGILKVEAQPHGSGHVVHCQYLGTRSSP